MNGPLVSATRTVIDDLPIDPDEDRRGDGLGIGQEPCPIAIAADPDDAEERLHPRAVDGGWAKLRVAEGQAVFFITRVGYLASGIAVEITTSYWLSEYFDFVAEMRRDL